MTWWQTDVAVKSLKLGIAGLLVGVLGFLTLFLPDSEPPSTRQAVGNIGSLARVRINLTQGLAFLRDGTLLYADGRRIGAVQPSGSTFEYLHVPGQQSDFIRDLTVGPDDEVYFSDDSNDVMRYVPIRMKIVLGSSATSRLNMPRGLALAPDGTLYVADLGNDRVLARAPDGRTKQVGKSLAMPNDMAVDPTGRSYVVSGARIYRVDEPDLVQVFDVRKAQPRVARKQLTVASIAFTPDGDLVIADELGCVIYRVHDGQANTVIGTGTCRSSPDGTPVDVATIASVWAVAVTADNRLIFSEDGGRLRTVQLTRQ